MSESTQIGLSTADYYFDLPQELIAQDPLEKRDECRLLVIDKETGKTKHKIFSDIIDYLEPGDCLVLNNTKVIPARLLGEKEGTGAAVRRSAAGGCAYGRAPRRAAGAEHPRSDRSSNGG